MIVFGRGKSAVCVFDLKTHLVVSCHVCVCDIIHHQLLDDRSHDFYLFLLFFSSYVI